MASAALKQIGPIPEPHYGQVVESNCNNLTCEEVRDIIASVVKDYINRTDYNSFPFAFQFFEFFEQARANDPYIDVATAFAQFKPDSNNEVALAHGSTCVGHSNELVKVLDDNRIKAHVVVETNGPNEPPSHAAVLVPCNNGVILVEIYDENPLIILKPDPAHEHNIGTDDLYINIRLIETSGNYKSDKLMISKTTVGVEKDSDFVKVEHSQYLLRPIYNPDQTVMKHYMMTKKNISCERANGRD